MPEKPEKLDPLKLSEQLEAKLGAEMDMELSAVEASKVIAQPEEPAVLPVAETEPAGKREILTQEEIDELLRGVAPADKAPADELSDVRRPESPSILGGRRATDPIITGEPPVFQRPGGELVSGGRRPAADLDAGLNSASSSLNGKAPFTEREEKTEVAEKFIVSEKSGTTEKLPIELIEVAEESEKESKKSEEIEAALARAREEYVTAWQATAKAEKETSKLSVIREKIRNFFNKREDKISEEFFVRPPERKEKTVGGAQAEAQEAKERFVKAQESLKVSIRAYRDSEVAQIEKKAREVKLVEKTEEEIKEEIEKQAKGILLATTLREAAKIDSLKTDKKIEVESMGKARRYVNEKTEEFTDWYKNLPFKYKILISGSLAGAGAITGSAAVLTAVMAGQMALRSLGGAMTTAGVEKLVKSLQEKSAEKKLTKEFEGKFLEALKNQNDALDDKLFEIVKGQQSAKNKRFIIAGLAGGIVGTGILASLVKEAFGASGGVKTLKSGQTMVFRAHPDNIAGKDIIDVQQPSQPIRPEELGEAGKSFLPESDISEPGGPEELGGAETSAESPAPEASMEAPTAENGGRAVESVESLVIGKRGVEGAIIDYFKDNPDVAKKFGWDGEADIKKWAGTKAHQLWLASVETELAKPGMAEKLTEQGFTPDAEGYAKAMRKIGQGFVELDGQGRISLSDNTSFFKAETPLLEELGGAESAVSGSAVEVPPEASAPAGEALTGEATVSAEPNISTPKIESLLNAEDLTDQKIKEAVTRFVDPAVLKDKTFKAAAKITLSQLLEEVPPEAYKGKYGLSQYWHSLSEPGVKTPKLPGTSLLGEISYDDFRKYAEMAKFLRENPALKNVTGLGKMTMEEFLHLYGEDLGRK